MQNTEEEYITNWNKFCLMSDVRRGKNIISKGFTLSHILWVSFFINIWL